MSLTDWLLLIVVILLVITFPERIAIVLMTTCMIILRLINRMIASLRGNQRRR